MHPRRAGEAIPGRLAGFIIEDQRAALRRRRAQTASAGLDDDLDF